MVIRVHFAGKNILTKIINLLRKVTDTKQFDLLTNVLDKSIIQVQKNDTSKYELYEYSKATDYFKLIAKEDETVQWKTSSIY